jgi:hypothetical protein
MGGVYGPEAARIAAGFPFDRFGSILDVGGGQGHILAAVLDRHPAIRGGVFDLPPTAAVARKYLDGRGLSKCEVFPGDFLESVTPGFDAYFLKSCLHDWDDEKSIRILRNCRDAMPAHGRVLICEIIVQPGKPVGHPHRLIDLEMMVTLGGRERTAAEYGRLLEGAGLKMEQAVQIENSFLGIVEGSRP